MRWRPAPLLIVACYGVLLLAWVVTNPPGAAPDESDHYLRALAAGRGDLLGRPNPALAGGRLSERLPKSVGTDRLSAAWGAKGSRLFRVPARMGPHAGFGCTAFQPDTAADCVDDFRADPVAVDRLSTMGTVEPAPYVLPGLATRLAGGTESGLLLARLAGAAVVLALLGAAVMVLWSWSVVALVGFVVAVTPMALFVGSTLGGSAAETGGAACFFAALVTAALGPAPARRATWAALGAGGVVLASSRSLGPAWIAIGAVAVAGAQGVGATWDRLRRGGRWAAGAGAAIVVAGVTTVGWEAVVQPGVDFDAGWFRHELPPAVGDLPRVWREMVGVFGWLDTDLPGRAYTVWALVVTALVVLALVVGTWRQRAVVVLLVPVVMAVTVLLSAGIMRQNGFGVQGRHVVPVATLLPFLAGAVVAANQSRLTLLGPHRLLLWFAVPVAAIQGLGWLTNARRYAVGAHGPWAFTGSSQWAPPGGWPAWIVAVAAALAAGVSGAVLASRPVRVEAHAPFTGDTDGRRRLPYTVHS